MWFLHRWYVSVVTRLNVEARTSCQCLSKMEKIADSFRSKRTAMYIAISAANVLRFYHLQSIYDEYAQHSCTLVEWKKKLFSILPILTSARVRRASPDAADLLLHSIYVTLISVMAASNQNARHRVENSRSIRFLVDKIAHQNYVHVLCAKILVLPLVILLSICFNDMACILSISYIWPCIG